MRSSKGFGGTGEKGIYFRGTGEQRPHFEGNEGTKTRLGNTEHKKTNFRFLGNSRGTSQFISGEQGNRCSPWKASALCICQHKNTAQPAQPRCLFSTFIICCVMAAVFVKISTYQLPGFKLLLSRMQFCFVLFDAVMFDTYAKDLVQIRPLTTELAALGYLKNQIIKLWSHRFLILHWIVLILADNEVNKILNKNFCQIQLRTWELASGKIPSMIEL